MWGKNKRHNFAVDTLVGKNSRVQGDIQFSGGFHVDGVIEGNIEADGDSQSVLSISEDGIVEGNVTVPQVILNGTVKGDVKVKSRVELGAQARVIGNVYYNLIEMSIGAEVNGKLIHEPEAQSAAAYTSQSQPQPNGQGAPLMEKGLDTASEH